MLSPEKFKIRPPITSGTNKEVAALKAQLTYELTNKKQCAYQPYECTQLTLDGFQFCGRHILQDRNAPFRQCCYVFGTNGKRCHLPAHKTEKKDGSYCLEHSIKTTLTRYHQMAKLPPQPSSDVMLCSLTQYVKKPRQRVLSSIDVMDKVLSNERSSEKLQFKSLDPFRDIDAMKIANNTCKDILDLASDSDSDVDTTNVGSVWHDYQVDASDNESIDSEQEDTLKHANIYTAEEITLITREKLIKLQSLYIEQYRHLQHVLKEKRRKYLHSLKREKETCSTIHSQVKDTIKEQRLYKKLKVLKRYHHTHGIEAILNKRLHDLRLKLTDGIVNKPSSHSKCIFTEGGVKCGERPLPLAKFCRKHILHDPNQVLFKACGKVKVDVECPTPIEVVFEDASCKLHTDMPSLRSYCQVRKNSESDFDDSLEASDNVAFLESQRANVETLPSREADFMDWKMDTLPSNLFEKSDNADETDSDDKGKCETVDIEEKAGIVEHKLETNASDVEQH